MSRLRYDGLTAALGADLTSSGTTVTFDAALVSDGGTAVPTISGSDLICLSILDTDGDLSEIVHLTAYTSGDTTGTISRGEEGTTGVTHVTGDPVMNAPTVLDFPVLASVATTGAYADLTGTPTLGTAAAANTGDFDAAGAAATALGIAEGYTDAATAGLAPLASPALTGNPTVPTQTTGDDTTKAASTAFVQTASGLLVPKSLVTTKGDLIVATGSGAVARQGIGSNNQVLTADSAQTNGLKWATPSSGFADPLTTKGDLIVHGSSTTRLGVGSDGQVLTADAASTNGVKWAAAAGGSATPAMPGWLAGNFYGNPYAGGSTTATFATAGVLDLQPLPVPFGVTVDQIVAECVAISTAVLRFGIYASDSNGRPGALIIDAGTITGASATVKTLSISQALAAGMCWLGMLVDTGGTGTWRSYNTTVVPFLGGSNVAAPFIKLTATGVTTGAMPTTLPTLTATGVSPYPLRALVRAA